MIKVEFLRSWRRMKPGDTQTTFDGIANLLVKRNIAKLVVDKPKQASKRSKGKH